MDTTIDVGALAALLAKLEIDAAHANQRMPVTRTGPREPISKLVRQLVYRRDRWTCVKCGDSPIASNLERHPDMLHLDHIIPWSAGGSDRSDNLRVLCKDCNERRSNRRDDMDTYRATPIARICDPCLRPEAFNGKPADVITVYCACHHHVSWVVDESQII